MTENKRLTFRLDELTQTNLDRLESWALSNGFSRYQSKTDFIKLALELVTEYFVAPFESDNTEDYSALRKRYKKAYDSDLHLMTQQLRRILSNQEMELILSTNLMSVNRELTPEQRLEKMGSYLTTGTDQEKVLSKVDEIMRENATIRVKQTYDN